MTFTIFKCPLFTFWKKWNTGTAQKIPKNYCPCFYLSIGQVEWVVVQKIHSKMHLASCSNTHHDDTDLVNHRMVKNMNIILLQNKKILNLWFRWHILRSYPFVAEVIFKRQKRVKTVVKANATLKIWTMNGMNRIEKDKFNEIKTN